MPTGTTSRPFVPATCHPHRRLRYRGLCARCLEATQKVEVRIKEPLPPLVLTPSYGPVIVRDGEGNVLRVIPVAELLARDLPQPGDTDDLLPMETPRASKFRGKNRNPHFGRIKTPQVAKRVDGVVPAETWPNFYSVKREKQSGSGRDWSI